MTRTHYTKGIQKKSEHLFESESLISSVLPLVVLVHGFI